MKNLLYYLAAVTVFTSGMCLLENSTLREYIGAHMASLSITAIAYKIMTNTESSD